MKKNILKTGLLLLTMFSLFTVQGQTMVNKANIVVNPGATLTIRGTLINETGSGFDVQGTLVLTGDVDNRQPNLSVGGNTVIDGTVSFIGSEQISFNNLSILAGSSLTIGSGTGNGRYINVTGSFTNLEGASGLTLTNDASLIESTGGVSATYSHIVGGNPSDWHLLSSPVAAQGIDPAFTNGAVYGWDEASQYYAKYGQIDGYPDWNTVNNSSNNFLPGKGYFVSYEDVNSTRNFSGTLNEGVVNFPLAKASAEDEVFHGFNLAGNPYPSGLDWKAVSGWTRSDLLEAGPGSYAYWVWNQESGNYGTFISDGLDGSGTNGVGRFIAPKQGFWVRAALNNGNLAIDNAARSHSTQEWLKDSEPSNEMIKLYLSNNANNYSDEIALEFHGKTGEASKLFSSINEAPELYADRNGTANSILRFRELPTSPVSIGLKAGVQATYTIQAKITGFEQNHVLLEDVATGVFTDLMLTDTYSFESDVMNEKNRFMLHFSPVGLDDNNSENRKVYYASHQILVENGSSDESAVIEVYDMRSNKVAGYKRLEQGLNHFNIHLVSGIYIVRITGKSMSAHKVLVIN